MQHNYSSIDLPKSIYVYIYIYGTVFFHIFLQWGAKCSQILDSMMVSLLGLPREHTCRSDDLGNEPARRYVTRPTRHTQTEHPAPRN